MYWHTIVSLPPCPPRYHQRDPLAGKVYVFVLTLMYLYYCILCFLQPEEVSLNQFHIIIITAL